MTVVADAAIIRCVTFSAVVDKCRYQIFFNVARKKHSNGIKSVDLNSWLGSSASMTYPSISSMHMVDTCNMFHNKESNRTNRVEYLGNGNF